MTDNRLMIGADIRKNALKLSCCQMNQKEMTNENYLTEEELSKDVILSKILDFLQRQEKPEKQKISVVFSCEDALVPMVKCVEKNLKEQGFEKENLHIISEENAFIHYVLNQEETIREYTVYLFDFDGHDLYSYRMAHSKKKTPLYFKAEKTLIGSFDLTGNSLEWGKIFDDKFAKLLKQLLSKEVVSAVYLTGEGFEGDWLKKSLKVLCEGRRAFLGQNLFSAGACYYASEASNCSAREYMIQAPETVLYDCGVLDSANKDAFVPITKAGSAWYETKGAVDVILERPGRVDVVFVNTLNKEKQVESVDVSDLSKRAKKIGRLHVEVEFFDDKSGVISVCDKGFGQFLPATHQVFLKEFTLI